MWLAQVNPHWEEKPAGNIHHTQKACSLSHTPDLERWNIVKDGRSRIRQGGKTIANRYLFLHRGCSRRGRMYPSTNKHSCWLIHWQTQSVNKLRHCIVLTWRHESVKHLSKAETTLTKETVQQHWGKRIKSRFLPYTAFPSQSWSSALF